MHTLHKSRSAAVPKVAVFGCGNTLLGDDGFGPAVIEALSDADLRATVCLVDAGTSIRDYLLEYLMLPALRPEMLIVADAGEPCADASGDGLVRRIRPAALSPRKSHDYSLHQFPTVNLLAELEQETGIRVELFVASLAVVPERIAPGLSPRMQAAVAEARDRILECIHTYYPGETAGTGLT
ncbi:hydrogenase maturation protease [Desulfobulbus alkaliphilus]|uniref:hydrogenase maturation protease n=1 Tax=Desulfobulbus alkaliphilus TaxID=869814 RepID=UPI001966A5E6|nr:hydrogenase maturation protease [Desulfobulbus alkaliphilus]MBM9535583.1 hydrogenase maturation protease [Desulfobulbus alkaliphilus]